MSISPQKSNPKENNHKIKQWITYRTTDNFNKPIIAFTDEGFMFKSRECFKKIIIQNRNTGSCAEGDEIPVPHYGLFSDIEFNKILDCFLAKMTVFTDLKVFKINHKSNSSKLVIDLKNIDCDIRPSSMVQSRDGKYVSLSGNSHLYIYKVTRFGGIKPFKTLNISTCSQLFLSNGNLIVKTNPMKGKGSTLAILNLVSSGNNGENFEKVTEVSLDVGQANALSMSKLNRSLAYPNKKDNNDDMILNLEEYLQAHRHENQMTLSEDEEFLFLGTLNKDGMIKITVFALKNDILTNSFHAVICY